MAFAAGTSASAEVPGDEYPRKHTLYVNFDGTELIPSHRDNSATDESEIIDIGDSFMPSFAAHDGDEQEKLAIVQGVQGNLEDYGVRVVWKQRPSAIVPYTMILIQQTDSTSGGPLGALDCGHSNQRRVGFTKATYSDGPLEVGNWVTHAAGHVWGLGGTENCSSVMDESCFPSGPRAFSSTCDDVTWGNTCTSEHEQWCGAGTNQQNEDAYLKYLFGDASPDVTPPTVEILEPADGEELDAGVNLELRASIEDDFGGVGWAVQIARDGETITEQVDFDKAWGRDDGTVALVLEGVSAGVYTLTVIAEDHANQATSDEVTIYVGVDAPSGTDETGGAEETGSADEGGAESPESADENEGCACRSAGDTPWTGWLVLVALFLRRRVDDRGRGAS